MYRYIACFVPFLSSSWYIVPFDNLLDTDTTALGSRKNTATQVPLTRSCKRSYQRFRIPFELKGKEHSSFHCMLPRSLINWSVLAGLEPTICLINNECKREYKNIYRTYFSLRSVIPTKILHLRYFLYLLEQALLCQHTLEDTKLNSKISPNKKIWWHPRTWLWNIPAVHETIFFPFIGHTRCEYTKNEWGI